MSTLTASSPLPDVHTSTGARTRSRVPALVVLATVVGFALIGPLVWSDPTSQRLSDFLQSPSWQEPLGRDHLGRSVMARLSHATRLSLGLAVLSVATAALLGTALGLLAASRGGWLDSLLRGFSEVMLALPALLVVLLFASVAAGGLWTLYVGMALAQWVEYFRVVRARSGVLLAGPGVEAAGLLGLGRWHVLRRHVWPEISGLLATLATVGLVASVLTMSTLGYVGVGVKPPRAELGLMLTESFPLYDEAPWLPLAPVVVLVAVTWALLALRPQEERS